VTGWLASKPTPWLAGIRHVVIDPYQPYATAVAKGLPAARLVVDHFHVIRLANTALDEVRRRTQQATTGHRGRKADPLYRIRRRLLAGHERLDPAGFARVLAWLDAGDPEGEVGAAYLAKELLRDSYLVADALEARRRLVVFYDYCAASDVPELVRLARTIARWETPILRWHHNRLTNATTEGTNLIVKNIKRLGFGFRNFDNSRLRLLLRCGAPWQHRPSHQYDPANHASARRAELEPSSQTGVPQDRTLATPPLRRSTRLRHNVAPRWRSVGARLPAGSVTVSKYWSRPTLAPSRATTSSPFNGSMLPTPMSDGWAGGALTFLVTCWRLPYGAQAHNNRSMESGDCEPGPDDWTAQ
jgi:hypothetical protein